MLLTTSIPGRKHHFWGAKSCSTFSPGLEVPAAAPAAAAAAPAAAPDGPTPEKTPENRGFVRGLRRHEAAFSVVAQALLLLSLTATGNTEAGQAQGNQA